MSTPNPKPFNPGKIHLPQIRRIIAVASGKGGVGKSTVAVNLAIALQQQGLRVGLLDCDIYGPSLPTLLQITERPKLLGERRIQPIDKHGLTCMSIGFMVDPNKALIWRGPMVMGAVEQMLRDVVWPELDILLIDMPPGTGDAHLTLCQRAELDGAVIVSTPQDISLIDARRGLQMFQQVGVRVLGIIENMSYFLCPHCNGRSDIFGHGGAEHEAATLGVPFLGRIPLLADIRRLGDSGMPIALQDTQYYKDIASHIMP